MFAERIPAVGPRETVADGRHTFRKFAALTDANPDVVNVTLFCGHSGAVCGWFIGPLAVVEGRAIVPHLPRSDETRADVAVVRAIEAGKRVGCPVCVIDPDDLWDGVWNA